MSSFLEKYLTQFRKSSLSDCTLREARVHGFYSGMTDASYSALLAACAASPFLFFLFTHGGSAVTLIAQRLGAERAHSSQNVRRDLAWYGATQSALLTILVLALVFLKIPDSIFSYGICAISLLSLLAGNFASPSWHATWATAYRDHERRAIISKRNFSLTLTSCMAILIASAALIWLDARSAIICMLSFSALGKGYSAFTLAISEYFPDQLKTMPQTPTISPKLKISPWMPRIIALYGGIGMSIALVVPYLVHFQAMTSSQVFLLGLTQIIGQLTVTAVFCRVSNRAPGHRTVTAAALLMALLPCAWCVAQSIISWHIIFFLGGVAAGAMSLLTQFFIQTPIHPREVTRHLSQITICTTLVQIAGGALGTALLTKLPFAPQECYLTVFLISALLRASSLLFPEFQATPSAEAIAGEEMVDLAEAA